MFLHPWWLVGLALVPILGFAMWSARDGGSIRYSSAAAGWDQSPTWRQRLAWLPAFLQLLTLVLMIVSLARPRYGREQTVVNSEGIAIEMVVDRSGSMQALDFQIDGQHVDRLTAIKNVASKFIAGEDDASGDSAGDGLSGRVSDLVGLVTFAGYADAITPPTLDHGFLVEQLRNTEIVRKRGEDGTAIGDAISLAVDKLSSLDDPADGDSGGSRGSRDSGEPAKRQGKVIILLTDGENTAGEVKPIQAAELAKAMKIKVYTIGVGTNGRAPFPVRRTRSGEIMVDYVDVNIDEETLKQIADQTGGKYFRATDTGSLEAIYDEIDQLEKTKVESQQFVDYRELAVQSVRIGPWWIPPLLSAALVTAAAAVLLRQTVFRTLS